MEDVTVLIPTYSRTVELAITLTSLAYQEYKNFSIFISDQNRGDVFKNESIQTPIRFLEKRGINVEIKKNLPRQGMAQQRQFLLDNSKTKYSLSLDDDVILEPWAIKNMIKALEEEDIGFVGMSLPGLSYLDDIRPKEQIIEFWEGKVEPEKITPGGNKWKRHKLHNAANILHIQEKLNLTPDTQKKYKIAWIGGCVMYDTSKLIDTGGFSFWVDLPKNHSGEDVYAQLKVMEKYGGCGLIPTGAYHQEMPTTITNRKVNVSYYLA